MRRRAHRLLLAGLVLTAAVLVPLLTTSAGARPEAPRAIASQSYTDGTGDSGNAPDIIGATVSDDSDGTLHFRISYHLLQCIAPPDYLVIRIDSDLNPNSGDDFGADYAILVNGDHSTSLGKWNGSSFGPASSSTLSASCGSSGDQITINRSDIGVAGSFNFAIQSVQGPDFDVLPNNGTDSYTLTAGPSPPPPPPPPPPPGPPPPPAPPPPPSGPNASFGANAPPHYAHWRVRFDAVTFGAASYAWQFGDDTTAQTKVPLAFHRYAAAGTFTVTLVITDAAGVQAQSSIQVVVAPLPAAERLPTVAGPSARSRKDPGYSRVASKAVGAQRSVFCWSAADWAVLEPAFDEKATGGYVDPAKPREIGLSPRICSRLDLVEYRKPLAAPAKSTALAVFVLASEIERSRGYVDPAQITCYGLQSVPDTSQLLGAGPAYAEKLGRLAAVWYSRRNLPAGYWSPQCRDGGKLDLDPANKHWP